MTTQCVILAGGLGTRMYPRTATIPKALLDVAGEPFVNHQLRWLASHGVDTVVLSIGHLGEMLRAHVGDGTRFGLREVRYVDEGEKLRGTAGALRFALEEGVLEERFLVTYGDSYLPIDFGALARAFEVCGLPAMMSVFRNFGKWDSSNAVVAGGRVTLYQKVQRNKVDHNEVDHNSEAAGFARVRMEYIDYGLLAFERALIEARVTKDARADMAELLHALSVEGQLGAYEATTRFYEIGSPGGLADLEELLAKRG